jgi:L1 cell adhesion molecule like protein
MVAEAEKYKDEDEHFKGKIEAKNKFEGYLYQLKTSVSGELKDKLSEDDKTLINDKIKDYESWFDTHPSEEKDVYESKQKELEGVFMEIMKNLSGGTMPENMNQPTPTASPEPASTEYEPKIEEID